MARIRTFIAVDPGKSIRDRLVLLQDKLAQAGAEVKWVEPQNLHFTLQFLGEVDQREVLEVCRVVKKVVSGHGSFPLKVEGTGCFPNPRRPRVLWVGASIGSDELKALHEALDEPLFELGCYRRESRAYTPHITLGRVKPDSPLDELLAGLDKHKSWSAGETNVKEVEVMSSELRPIGPVYTVLSKARLK